MQMEDDDERLAKMDAEDEETYATAEYEKILPPLPRGSQVPEVSDLDPLTMPPLSIRMPTPDTTPEDVSAAVEPPPREATNPLLNPFAGEEPGAQEGMGPGMPPMNPKMNPNMMGGM